MGVAGTGGARGHPVAPADGGVPTVAQDALNIRPPAGGNFRTDAVVGHLCPQTWAPDVCTNADSSLY